MSTAISTRNLGKEYTIYHQQAPGQIMLRESLTEALRGFWRSQKRTVGESFWALSNLDIEIQQGECVGIIGGNGAGKSTLLKILSRITYPTTGEFTIRGSVSNLLEVGTGFHPELTGRDNIFLSGAVRGMKKNDIKSRFDEIVAFAETEKFLDTPVKHYSSGMYARLAFAVASHLESDVLIVDEVLSVGDAAFRKKCLDRMEALNNSGRTLLFVSHSAETVSRLCKRGIYLESGRLKGVGDVDEILSLYESSDENR